MTSYNQVFPLLRASVWGSGPVDVFLPLALILTIIAAEGNSAMEASRNSGDSTSKAKGSAETLLRVLFAFLLGAIASLLGCLASWAVSPWLGISQKEAARAAGSIAATYIGGSINFIATARAVQLNANTLGALAAADILLMGSYFAVLSALHRRSLRSGPRQEAVEQGSDASIPAKAAAREVLDGQQVQKSRVSVRGRLKTFAVLTVVVGAAWMGSWPLQQLLGSLPGAGTVAMTASSWFVARVLTRRGMLSAREAAASKGTAAWVMLAFFASIGAEATIVDLLTRSIGFTIFAALALCIHGGVLSAAVLLLGKLVARTRWSRWKVSLDEAIVASNANIGGPATAAACAGTTLNRPDLVFPGTFAGILGYGTATTIGVYLTRALISA